MTPGVEAAFRDISNSDAVRYAHYWDDLTARTPSQLFRRFLFAYCSVHTIWETNVRGFESIRDFSHWLDSHAGLRTRLVQSGVGLHNNRTRWIGDFANLFWADPRSFLRGPREGWPAYRDRLEERIVGLGPAKVSFALELAYPLEAEVVCLDVHMLRMYGVTDQAKVRVHQYEAIEHDWVSRARAAGLPSFVVKQVAWDRLQGRPDSRYWSHCLEGQ